MYLPKPLPDELLGSAVNRGAFMTGNSFKAITKAIYGTSKDKSSLLLPAATYRIAMLMGISPLEALWNHTMIPYITAYHSAQSKQKIISELLLDKPSSTKTGPLVKSLMKSLRFRRHCRQCIMEDVSTYGFSYWRRQHCLPGVEHCPTHLTSLSWTRIPLLTKTRVDLKKDIFQVSSANNPTALERHILISSLAALKTTVSESENSRENFRYLAAHHGYLLPNRRIFVKKLAIDLHDWLPLNYMQTMDCEFRADSTSGWPATILRTTREVGTQKHIIMKAFFSNVKNSDVQAPKRGGPVPRDYIAIDKKISAILREQLKTGHNAPVTATELLRSLGIFSTYRHNRERMPQTRKIVEEIYQRNRPVDIY